MRQAKTGDTVAVIYRGRLNDGTPIKNPEQKEPTRFTIGKHNVLLGLEQAVRGMHKGETKKVSIPPEQAYGHYREGLVLTVPRTSLPPQITPRPGKRLQICSHDGRRKTVTITHTAEDSVTLDANHQMAGRELELEITLVDIESNVDKRHLNIIL